MKTKLWQECLSCKAKNKCCGNFAYPLFVTPEEKKKLLGINTQNSCIFFNQKGLCDINNEKPFDCRLFPFDIWKLNKKFTWVIWKVDCLILNKNREELELYLQDFERKLIPKFRKYLDDYQKFEGPPFFAKCQYEVLREVKFYD